MNHPNGMECDKIASWSVLENLQSRVKYDHDIDAIIEGRLALCYNHGGNMDYVTSPPKYCR